MKRMNIIIESSYNLGVFPSIMGFLLVNIILVITTIDQQVLSLFEINPLFSRGCHLLLISLSSFVFFSEWKIILVKRKGLSSGLARCNSRYISIYLSYTIILAILLSMGYKQIFSYCRESVLGVVLLFLGWLIFNRPYDWKIHNAAQIINLIVTAIFIGWTIIRNIYTSLQVEDTEIFLMLIFIVLLLTVVSLAIARTVIELRFRLKTASKLMIEHSKTEEQKKS